MRGEFAAALQDATPDPRTRWGASGLVSCRIIEELEPVLPFDLIRLDGDSENDRLRPTAEVIRYPMPDRVPG